MIPTSIDGTDITGATIDGTDVTEITVDGQTVFTAGPNLPVAYSNLVAWYAFDSAEYGGSNADDVTAILGGSGDDTAYNGTVNGATYQLSGGVTDINAGANSGAFDFDGNSDGISITNVPVNTSDFTLTAWVEVDRFDSDDNTIFGNTSSNNAARFDFNNTNELRIFDIQNSFAVSVTQSQFDDGYHFVAARQESNGDVTLFRDNAELGSGNTGPLGTAFNRIGFMDTGGGRAFFDGAMDDLRIYNTALTDSQISDMYNNTKP